jgi:hypothetical protein
VLRYMTLLSTVCAVIGYLASYWNRVMMPESCRDSALDNSQVYNTLIRSAGSWASLGLVVQMLMQKFSWRHTVVLSDQRSDKSVCSYGAQIIFNQLSSADAVAKNFSVLQIPMSDSPSPNDYEFYFDTLEQRARGKINFCYGFWLPYSRIKKCFSVDQVWG